jgi:hypothetical protein
LRKIILRPVIDLINKKASARKLLISHLSEKELSIQHLLNKKNQELIDFKIQVQSKYKAPLITIPEIKSEFSYTRDPESIKNLINLSKNIIVERVSDAL